MNDEPQRWLYGAASPSLFPAVTEWLGPAYYFKIGCSDDVGSRLAFHNGFAGKKVKLFGKAGWNHFYTADRTAELDAFDREREIVDHLSYSASTDKAARIHFGELPKGVENGGSGQTEVFMIQASVAENRTAMHTIRDDWRRFPILCDLLLALEAKIASRRTRRR